MKTNPVSQLGVTLAQLLLKKFDMHMPAEGCHHVTGRKWQGSCSCRSSGTLIIRFALRSFPLYQPRILRPCSESGYSSANSSS